MIDVKQYVKYNSFLIKNVKLKTEIYIYALTDTLTHTHTHIHLSYIMDCLIRNIETKFNNYYLSIDLFSIFSSLCWV